MQITTEQLLELIPKSNKKTITAKKIAEITGAQESYIRRKINEVRTMGFPICSTRHGYYYSTNPADIMNTIRFLRTRLKTQLQAIIGLENIKISQL